MNLPRLTGALRAFSNISPHLDLNDDLCDLIEKRKLRTERRAKNYLTWILLKNTLIQHAKTIDINTSIKDLMQAAKDIVGCEATMQMIESACVHLFIIFKDSTSIRQCETKKLRHLFGPFPASVATKACNVVNHMVSTMPEDVLNKLQFKNTDPEAEREEFGQGIKFCQLKQPIENGNMSDSDLDEEEYDSTTTLDFKFQESCKKNDNINNDHIIQKQDNEAAWLRNQVEQYFGSGTNSLGLSVNDICTSVFDMLCSNKSDNELQNDLFELLGFDRFELIKILLQRRQQFVAMTINNQQEDANRSYLSNKTKDPNARPLYGCQVTVQSEQEKQLNKICRKEEKKVARRERKDEDTEVKEKTFDPQEMRTKREAALMVAKNTPILSGYVLPSTRESYPFVYDSYAEARQSSAFISGTKMVLPIGFERLNNKIYEEINIPPSQPYSIEGLKDLIPISSLDKIGQIAFQGMKLLNRIQSIVFDTAYHTNENLLICAPTGAGKTNIALLAILHEIKQHIVQDILRKDEFKIVYVAPMKALAAEMTRNFGKRLEPLGITVKELTGDMSLTKSEILQTQMLVTTPEKWDVVTRKSTGDVSLSQLVRLLIIDEVHLLHDDRGPVIETLVARTLRQVETTQSMIRIIGLSATLPNYLDVAQFLRVSPYKGLFFFDGRFRPVPLGQTYIGIKAINTLQQMQDMDAVCYEKILEQVRRGHQVMVFVHARNATVRTAMALRELATNKGDAKLFRTDQDQEYGTALKQVTKSRNKQLRDLFADGFSIHHAGMLRADRNLVEKLFSSGTIKVLVCTATLAWGVNLPAHAVIIKGTQIYDARRGTFVDLGILDVMQIFGRAGRPQFDTYGHGTIITCYDKLSHYLSLMTRQHPIESQFVSGLEDNLNAEVSLGTVCNVEEAVEWLSYTYLFIRMRHNPQIYGINYKEMQDDPDLLEHRRKLIFKAAEALDKARMIRFDTRTENLACTDLGRIASHYYIKYDTVEVVNESFKPLMTEADVLAMVSKSQEFQQIKVRDDELEEMDNLMSETCYLPVAGGSENSYGKVNILLQNYISHGTINSFSLISDSSYIIQNATRIIRAVFEIAVRKGHPIMAGRLLTLCKTVERQLWGFENPLKQFDMLSFEILRKIEEKNLTIDKIKEMDSKDIGLLIHHVKMGKIVKQCAYQLPMLDIEAFIQPITRTVLRVRLTISAEFSWNDRVHGKNCENFWIWVEDPETNHMYHHEFFSLLKKQVILKEAQTLMFTIPIFDPLPSQYYVRAISDRWLGSETVCPISFKHLILPERHPPHTELLDLQPLPLTALNDSQLQSIYKFTHFNPIQTQIFYCLFHTDTNVLLGAPTGSGKTVAAELAIFRIFRVYPKTKAVYIAPLKALVRERILDWKFRFEQKLNKKVVELTGDVTPDMNAIMHADVIVTTPEKWDGISRSWQTRNYVKAVSLIVIDEIHLLGEDRGPVLEVIVSRTNFISSHTTHPVRVIGLSTALANARDLADWLNIKQLGLFNFKPSVRPVPLEVHISGFPGKHYCPRMATMNKPALQAIRTYSTEKPVLIFVSSRRQTRLTALDLIAYLATENQPKMWLHMPESEIENIIHGIRDNNLKLTLAFGIGIHHAGLHEKDRRIVEELFINQKIQVLIATATLAWGVNFPAHLVILKGTEYYDGKTKRYLDYPITDVLQMMGRAGRPQYDDQGVAVILVHDVKKHFYKKFLYEPFPVESSLLEVLPDHLNAEIVAGTITSKQDAMDYITWTYFFRRVVMNPSYYSLEDVDHDSINKFLSSLVEKSVITLEASFCLEIGCDNRTLTPLTLGKIASFYYLSHQTLKEFRDKLKPDSSIPDLLEILANAHEYAGVPVRHNEDAINGELAKQLPLEVNPYTYNSSHTKANLLFQAHFCRHPLPSTDYQTDRKTLLDQAIRILQAMIDVVADQGWLATALRVMQLVQMVIQAQWIDESPLLMLPNIASNLLHCFRVPELVKQNEFMNTSGRIESIPELICYCDGRYGVLASMLEREIDHSKIEQIYQVLRQFPILQVELNIKGWWEGETGEQVKPVIQAEISGIRPSSHWISLHADQEYTLTIDLNRCNRMKKFESKAYTPRFPKNKDEGWWLVLGDVDSKELIAMKRVGHVRSRSSTVLSFYSPEKKSRVIYTLYVMSDSYVGLDQQYDICLDIISASLEAQVNTDDIDFQDE